MLAKPLGVFTDPFRLAVVLLNVGGLVALLACHRVKAPASVVRAADVATSAQLISGFFSVEMNSWRWTGQRFLVGLGPPAGAVQHGARLILHLYIPDVQIQKLGPMTLSASAAGAPLTPETFSKEGSYDYSREVPATVLDTNIVPVQFSFDKANVPSPAEVRDLAAVVTAVELKTNP